MLEKELYVRRSVQDNTQLVIEDDTIYEMDEDCMKNRPGKCADRFAHTVWEMEWGWNESCDINLVDS